MTTFHFVQGNTMNLKIRMHTKYLIMYICKASMFKHLYVEYMLDYKVLWKAIFGFSFEYIFSLHKHVFRYVRFKILC